MMNLYFLPLIKVLTLFWSLYFRLFKENFEKSFNTKSKSASEKQNDWLSYSYNSRSTSSNSQGISNNFLSGGSSYQTSPCKESTTSNGSSSSSSGSSVSSWYSSAMSRWPSSASFSSTSSTKTSRSCWSDTQTKSQRTPQAPNSSRSNSFDEQNKRLFYASHSIFLNTLRSASSDDSFDSDFDKFYVSKK